MENTGFSSILYMFFPVKISIFHETGLRQRLHASVVLAIDFSHKIAPKESFWRKNKQMAVFWNTCNAMER
jgi:hypothetical protein